MDFLPYRRTNRGITILYHLTTIDLAHYEIVCEKVCGFSGKSVMFSSKGGVRSGTRDRCV